MTDAEIKKAMLAIADHMGSDALAVVCGAGRVVTNEVWHNNGTVVITVKRRPGA